MVGSNLTVECNITADPAVGVVHWTIVGVDGSVTKLNNSLDPSKYSGSTPSDPSLTIINVDFSDEGNYSCYAQNIAGDSESTYTAVDVIGNY